MWRKLTIFFLIVAFKTVLFAQNANFEIQRVNDVKIRLTPGVSSNIVIKLVNNSSKDQQVSLKLDNPNGLKCFSGLKDIQTPKSKSTIKFLSFNVPANSLAGDYFIYIAVFDSMEKKIADISLPVTIEPKYELNIEMISAPEYVFAGDTFSVQFMLQNLSNNKSEIEAILKGNNTDEKMSFLLGPDSSVFITRKMRAEKGIFKYIQKHVSLTAFLFNRPEVRTSNYHFYKVIPSGEVKFDPYNRFPVQFSTLFISNNQSSKRLYALMFDVAGQGFLDEKKRKHLISIYKDQIVAVNE